VGQKLKKNEKSIAYLLGAEAFKAILNASTQDEDPSTKRSLLDDPEIVFEYLYLGVASDHPTKPGKEVVLAEKDRENFLEGWISEEDVYEKEIEKSLEKACEDEKNNKRNNDKNKYFGSDFDYFNYNYSKYAKYAYVEPKFIYDRFSKVEKSTKKIIFPKEFSELFWNIFQTASGKEIMFYGELNQTEENPDIYTVSGINFPPQKNYGGYVETVDGKYEEWVFNEIILKNKKIPLHVHTHPDFSAFSSSVDEKQIKQYIEDNEGNPFVIQLIVSNPRKGTHFVRWFDLENNTWEKPSVEFTFDKYDVESLYPGIFQFNAPARFVTHYSSRSKDSKNDPVTEYFRSKGKKDYYSDYYNYYNNHNYDDLETDEDEDDAGVREGKDLLDPEEFDRYFNKNYKKLTKTE
jgi:hypothetical protein